MDRTSIAKKLKEGRNMDEITLPDFEAFYEVWLIMSFRTGRGTRDQIANIHWTIEKASEFQKNIYFCILTMPKPMTMWITINCEKF